MALIGAVGPAEPASAHDPGQGDLRGDAELTAIVRERTVEFGATIVGPDCEALDEATVVARRAGMIRSAPMTHGSSCTYTGELTVPEGGRWFVYASFATPEGALETWLPVEVTDGEGTSASRDLYQPPTRPDRASQSLVGAALVVAAAVLLWGSLRTVAAYPPPGPAAG